MRIALAALFAVAACDSAPPEQAIPVNVGGRAIVADNGSLRFGWPAVYFEARFRGTGVHVKLDAPGQRMRLLVDGNQRIEMLTRVPVDIPLGGYSGEHIVRLETQSENQTGAGRLIGVFPLGDTVPLPPAPRPRQIEFIGDSYTVGYGNSSDSTECAPDQVHDQTNTQYAFGPLVARQFNADYRVIAYSGLGIVRNYDGTSPDKSLPAIYPRLMPSDANHLDKPSARWRPQLIVINLGTNDFSTPLRTGERWPDQAALRTDYRRRYVAFGQELMAAHPQARVILMGSELFFAEVEKVAAELNANAARVGTLRFDGLDYSGCHHHPSIADHRRLAALLERVIGEIPHIWERKPISENQRRRLLDRRVGGP